VIRTFCVKRSEKEGSGGVEFFFLSLGLQNPCKKAIDEAEAQEMSFRIFPVGGYENAFFPAFCDIFVTFSSSPL
jgi:hypothetical protein